MKKTILLILAFAFAFAAAGFGAEQSKTDKPYNGITYFDLGQASTGQQETAIASTAQASTPYNGITYFDLGRPGTALKKNYAATGFAAGGAAPQKKPNNGITVF